MQRTKPPLNKPVLAILVSDLHLTEKTPIARTDDYWSAQVRKLEFLQTQAQEYRCPVICAGDVFDHWKASPWLISQVYQHLPRPFVAIPGQHDLPNHSLELYPKSTLALLESVDDDIHILTSRDDQYHQPGLSIVGIPYGEDWDNPRQGDLLILHTLVWPDKPPVWSQGSSSSKQILSKFGGDFTLILTGDNHRTFTTSNSDTILVNPGSMMRQSVDQVNHHPVCYLYHGGTDITSVELPIQDGVLNQEHINLRNERDGRMKAYIEQTRRNWKTGLSFSNNLEAFFAEQGTPQKVREIIWQALEAE